jgi:hypothetical protein
MVTITRFNSELYQHCWRPPRPSLTIEHKRTQKAGHCYEISTYVVTSLWRLTKEQLGALHNIGVLGSGQSCKVTSQCDGKELPTLHVQAEPMTIDRRTGERVETAEPPCNEYTGKPLAPIPYDYFTYTCEIACDSGD